MSRQEAKEKAEKAIQEAMNMVEETQKSISFHLLGRQVEIWIQPLADYIQLLEKDLVEREERAKLLQKTIDSMKTQDPWRLSVDIPPRPKEG